MLAPENTLDAYGRRLLMASTSRVDVRETKDGQFVANHDETATAPPAHWKVADLTLASASVTPRTTAVERRPFDPSRIARSMKCSHCEARRCRTGTGHQDRRGCARRIAQHVTRMA
jgi:glycerophosphoryl diester phosphodiesterase